MERSLWSSLSALALTAVAAAHAVFAWHFRDMKPDLSVLVSPPSAVEREVLSFGDHQFLYRMWTLDLQNAGDTGGRATPMRDYNYEYVVGWLDALHGLDPHGQHHMFLAASYFSLTPVLSDVRRIVDFLERTTSQNPREQWYWMAQAVTIAEARLNDLPRALEISRRLAGFDIAAMPGWLVIYPALLLEKLGQYAEAAQVIEDALATRGNVFSSDDQALARNTLKRVKTHLN